MAFWDPLGLYSRSCYNCVFFLKERSTFQCLFPAFQRCSLLHKWHFGGTTVNPELRLLPTWERSRSTALPLPAPRLRCFLGSSGSEAVPGALVWGVQETFPGPPLLCPGLVRSILRRRCSQHLAGAGTPRPIPRMGRASSLLLLAVGEAAVFATCCGFGVQGGGERHVPRPSSWLGSPPPSGYCDLVSRGAPQVDAWMQGPTVERARGCFIPLPPTAGLGGGESHPSCSFNGSSGSRIAPGRGGGRGRKEAPTQRTGGRAGCHPAPRSVIRPALHRQGRDAPARCGEGPRRGPGRGCPQVPAASRVGSTEGRAGGDAAGLGSVWGGDGTPPRRVFSPRLPGDRARLPVLLRGAGTSPRVLVRGAAPPPPLPPVSRGWCSWGTMKVKVISVLEDNYMYLVIEESTRDAVAVDAAVPKRVRGASPPAPSGHSPTVSRVGCRVPLGGRGGGLSVGLACGVFARSGVHPWDPAPTHPPQGASGGGGGIHIPQSSPRLSWKTCRPQNK